MAKTEEELAADLAAAKAAQFAGMTAIELDIDQVSRVASQVDIGPDSGAVYEAGKLYVPAALASAVSAADPDDDKPRLLSYAAARRFVIETGGVTVNGAEIDTSRDSQAMITGAYAYSQANPSEAIKFKAASGWVTLDAATLAAIATAVGAHVQACFATEASVAADIDAGTITTPAEIDAADWPA